MKTYLYFSVFLLVSFVAKAQTPTVQPITSSGPYCVGSFDVFTVTLPAGCNFQYWYFTGGTMSTSNGTGTTSQTIDASFSASGILYAVTSCGSAPYTITIIGDATPPTVDLTVDHTTVTYGAAVNMTVTGNATSYSWSGNGLLSNTGTQVTAIPSFGTNTYYVTGSVVGCGTTNTTTKSVTVVASLPPLNVGSDRSYCQDAGTIDLSTWGLSLSDGVWSGQGITNNSTLNISLLTPGTPYPYVYTRTADQQSGTIKVTVFAPTPAALADSPASSACSTIAGTLTANGFSGVVKFWERSTDQVNWSQINSSLATLSYSETQTTYYRVVTQATPCSIVRSAFVTVTPLSPVAGNLSPSNIQSQCGRATGILVLGNYAGDTFSWEYSIDGTNWSSITGVSGNSYAFDVNFNQLIRVGVKYNSSTCPIQYSNAYTIQINSVGGNTSSNISGNVGCQSASGDVFLNNNVGLIQRWESSTDNSNWTPVANSMGLNPLPIHTTSPDTYYRAQVQLQSCAVAYSDSYHVIVSQPLAGAVEMKNFTTSIVDNVKTYNVTFQLDQPYSGTISEWIGKQSTQTVHYAYQTETVTLPIDQTTQVSALVQTGGCGLLSSGSAFFVVNAPSQGVLRVIDSDISIYDGHSYKYGDEFGLHDGFTFVAYEGDPGEPEFFVFLDPEFSPPPAIQNYVLSETILDKGLTDESRAKFLSVGEKTSDFSYFDGIGRGVQKVQRWGSPDQNDVVQPVAYDNFGRVDTNYLPYTLNTNTGQYQTSAIQDQSNFYKSPFPKIAEDNYPFAVKVFEASPLNRTAEQGAPGADWQPGLGKTVKYLYQSNNGSEIILWSLDETGMPVKSGNYSSSELYISAVVDEHGSTVKEYKNKKGLTVLKRVQLSSEWLDTYYIYDAFNLLRYVLQPEGVANLSGNPDTDFLDKWAFQYTYDDRYRMITKKTPGAAIAYMVYDQLDRLVMTQDGNQRVTNQWSFTKYDAQDRPVVTGIYTHNNAIGQSDMSALISATSFYEAYDGTNTFFGYTNSVFPTQSLDVMTVTYYDDYRFLAGNFNFVDPWGTSFNYNPHHLEGLPDNSFSYARALSTGSLARVIGTNKFLRKVAHYDSKYRVIQVVSDNHLLGFDRQSTLFDFPGRIVAQYLTHTMPSQSDVNVMEEFNYDHQSRLISQYHKINDGPKVLLKQSQYNEVGQLVEKNVYSTNNGFSQSIDYRYNIRGWLTHINNADLVNDGGVTNNDANDFFGFELKYNGPSSVGSAAQFNGNISETQWKIMSGDKQAYSYTYDPLNRLKASKFRNISNPLDNDRFNEEGIEYDRNGNIRFLNRNGKKDATSIGVTQYGLMDQLRYDYNGNQLTRVTDSAPNTTSSEGGFIDGNTTGTDYDYDANGNLKLDNNKSITSITYNYLNLPDVVTKNNGDRVKYTYDATGVKLSQLVTPSDSSNPPNQTDYSNEMVYENGVLQFIAHDEGRVVMKPLAANENGVRPEYQYHLKDHLGNTRLTFTTQADVDVTTATHETANLPAEHGQFLRYDDVRMINAKLFDHTHLDPSNTYTTFYSERLNGTPNEQHGLARSLSVMPGDTLDIEVWGKYVDIVNADLNLQTFLASIANGTAAAGTVVDGSNYGTAAGNAFPFDDSFLDKQDDPDAGPKAFLNFLVYDRDYNRIDSQCGYMQLPNDAGEDGSGKDFKPLNKRILIDKPGYVYIYLSNDNVALGGNSVEVYFDDFKVTHRKSQIVQSNDYYGFGLSFNEFNRENSPYNKFQYNGKEKQDAFELNWIDYGARMYDPAIGRWSAIDLFSDVENDVSPYNYVRNNVIKYTDPDGHYWVDEQEANRLLENLFKLLIQLVSQRENSDENNDKNMSDKEKKAQQKKNRNLDRRINELTKSIGDVLTLGTDPNHAYDLKKGDNQGAGKQGVMKESDGTISIYGLADEFYVHEIRHVANNLSGGLRFTSDGHMITNHNSDGGLYEEISGYNAQFGYSGLGIGREEAFDELFKQLAMKTDENGAFAYPFIKQAWEKRQNEIKKQKAEEKKKEKK